MLCVTDFTYLGAQANGSEGNALVGSLHERLRGYFRSSCLFICTYCHARFSRNMETLSWFMAHELYLREAGELPPIFGTASSSL